MSIKEDYKMKRFRITFSGEGWRDIDCEGIFIEAPNAMVAGEYANRLLDYWEIDRYGVKPKIVEDRDEVPNLQSSTKR